MAPFAKGTVRAKDTATFGSSTLTIAIALQSLAPAGEEARVCQDWDLSGLDVWAVTGGFPLPAEEIGAGSG